MIPDEEPKRKPTPQEAWRNRHPQASWAHMATRSAIRRGLIQRQPCADCGSIKAEAHHPDYDRPLDVVWLCRKHHKAAHPRKRGAT